MAESITYNMDCMDFLKTVPDKYYDIAVVDPPFGSGLTDNGGCKGWFTKYHQDTELKVPAYNRFGNPGSRFEKYKRDAQLSTHTHTHRRRSCKNRRNMG